MSETEHRETSYAFRSGHHGFDPPSNPDIPLWRYMNFTKLISLLERGALYFSRTDLLGDPWEGSLTRLEAQRRAKLEAGRKVAMLHSLIRPKIIAEVTNSIVSCWHMNEYESMAMWRLYLTGSEGVVVKSTYRRLISSFPQCDGRHKGRNDDNTEKELLIDVGVVHYVDYESLDFVAFPKMLRKRKSFEHEREIWAVATDTTWGNSLTFDSEGWSLTRFA